MPIVKPRSPVLQRGHPLAQGLAAGYPSYEGAGTTLNDLSGNRNNLAFVGSPTWAPGMAGGFSLSFSGSSGRISKTGAVGLPGGATQPWAFGAWINTSTYTSLSCPLFWGNTLQTGGQVRGLLQFQSNYYFWGSSADWNSGVAFDTDGLGHRIIFSNDGSNFYLYRDGKLAAGPVASAMSAATTSLAIALNYTPAFSVEFTGKIDGFFISGRHWNAADAALDYFDSFAIYRPHSPWVDEAVVSGGAFTNRPGPRMGPALPFGLAIGGAYGASELLKRNPVVPRRKLVRWWE